MPARMLLASMLVAMPSGGDGRPAAHLFVAEGSVAAWERAAPPSPTQERRWLARGGPAVWWVDPAAHQLRRCSSLTAEEDEGRAAAWPLPAGLDLAKESPDFIGLAPWGAEGTWLVEGGQQRLWRLRGGVWEGPWPLPDEVTDAVALGEHEIVANTPGHPLHPFTVVGAGGRVVRRFGDRRRGPLPALDEAENTWRLAASPEGQLLVAVHAFRPLVAAWRLDGTRQWERVLQSPEARRLGARQGEVLVRARQGEQSGCTVCLLVRVGTAVAVDGRGGVWVRLGEAAALESLSPEGAWEETVPVQGTFAPVGGVVLVGSRLAAWQAGGVDVFRLAENTARAVLRVEAADGRAVRGAKAVVTVSGGVVWDATTDAAGRASFPAPPPGSLVTIAVKASGFRRGERQGLAPEVFAEPLRLEAADEVCVRVTAAGSAAPVRSFSLVADRVIEGGGNVGIEEGEAVAVEDESGRGCVAVSFPYPVELRVAAEEFASWRGRLSGPPDADVPVELGPAAVLSVVVTDRARRPIPEAWVVLEPAAIAERTARAVGSDHVGRTDEKGEVVLPRLDPGSYRVSVKAEGFLAWEASWEMRAGRTERHVALDRGGRVLVSVSSHPDRRPIPGAQVELAGLPDAAQRPTCTTDGAGRCTLSGIPPGSFTVRAQAEKRVGAVRRVHLREGQDESQVEIPLARGARVEGQVRGTEDYPDVPLVVRATSPGMAPVQVPLAETGRFLLEDVPVGDVQVWVRDGGTGGTLAHRVVTVPAEQEMVEVEIDLPRPLSLRGEVRNGEAPCVGCRVVMVLLGAEVQPPQVARMTDQLGHFEARLPQPGTWRIQVWSPSGSLGVDDVLSLTMDEHRIFEMGLAILAGRVVTADSSPVKGATVRLFGGGGQRSLGERTTDVAGQFEFVGLPAGSVRVVGMSQDRAGETTVQAEAGTRTHVELVLRGEGTTTLRLRNAVSGTLISGAAAFGVLTDEGYGVFRQNATPDGVFRLPMAPTNVAALVVGVPGHALTTVRGPLSAGVETEVRVSPHSHSFTLEVRPDAPSPCSLTILDPGGQPIALSVDWPPGPVPFFARSALFNFLPAGVFTLVVSPCKGDAITRPLPLLGPTPPHVVVP